MTNALRTRAALAAVALLAVPLALPAAPVPAAKGVSTRLLPDDAHFVAVVNVRQALASPLYDASLRKSVDELLKNEQVPKPVREIVPAVLRDVDRLTVVTLDASFITEGPGGGPVLIAEGRLGPDWLKARAGELNAAAPDALKEADQSGVTAFEAMAAPRGPGGYLLAPDRNTVVFVPTKELFAEFVAKSAGKRATVLKHAALREQLRKMSPDAVAQWAGVKEMVIGAEARSVRPGGGKAKFERTMLRIGDQGIDSVSGTLSVDDAVQFKLAFAMRDADSAAKMLENTHKALEGMSKELQREARRQKGFEPVLRELSGVKTTVDGNAVGVSGRFSAEALRGLFDAWAAEVGLAPPGK